MTGPRRGRDKVGCGVCERYIYIFLVPLQQIRSSESFRRALAGSCVRCFVELKAGRILTLTPVDVKSSTMNAKSGEKTERQGPVCRNSKQREKTQLQKL